MKKEELNQIEKIKKKEEVEKWRKNKEQEQKEYQENQAKLLQAKKAKELENMIKLNQLKHQKIKEYKENTENFDEKHNISAVKDIRNSNKVPISNIDLERIKEKNELLIKKKVEAKRSKSSIGIKVETNYINYKENKKSKIFANVNSKLNENTTIFELKKRNKFDPNKEKSKDAFSLANNVLGKTALKVPQWRKGL